MRPIPCFKQDRRPENVLTDGFATVGQGISGARRYLFRRGSQRESSVKLDVRAAG
jgi:hypothetical protein